MVKKESSDTTASTVLFAQEGSIVEGQTSAALAPQLADPSDTDGLEPTEEELLTLRRVADPIPWTVVAIAGFELCERFAYFGTVAVLTNYVQWPLPSGSSSGAAPDGQPGALGLGQRAAFGVTTFVVLWQYTTPLLGAYVADVVLGRYRTLAVALAIDLLGHLVVLAAGLPPLLRLASQSGPTGSATPLAVLVIGILIMGLGTGGFKPNISPLIVEQLPSERMRVTVLPATGERVIRDPAVSTSRVFHYVYLIVNVGALLGQISLVCAEKYVGFWLSFTMPIILLATVPVALLLWGRHRYRRRPPAGSVLAAACRLVALACRPRIPDIPWYRRPADIIRRTRDGSFWADVLPSRFAPADRPAWMTFDDAWVAELRRGLCACAVFLWSPFFWLCYNQLNGNMASQAAVMHLGAVPNDVVSNLNPVILVVLIPCLDGVLYPLLRRARIPFTPIKRITAGYALASLAMVWAAAVQAHIYRTSECGAYASSVLAEGGRCPSVSLSVWAQAGFYGLMAAAESLAAIPTLEYAQSKAPATMRSMVQAVALAMNAVSCALGFVLVGLAADPYLVWYYGVVAALAGVATVGFWLTFRGLDAAEDALNMLPEGRLGGTAEEEV